MTSECFVYITLPSETEFVTAGRYKRTIDRHGVATGRFVYGRSYLARDNAVPIDPIELKLSTKTYDTTLLKGIFGALRDASPDHWGRRVIERHFGSPGPDELDYLLHSPDDRAGALGFGLNKEPPAPRRKFNRMLDLEKLQEFADAIIKNEKLPQTADAEQAQELMLEGTSMGGARPKAVVEDDGALWIAKFNRPDDKWNHAKVERAMLELAHACDIQRTESKPARIGERDALLVKRFDRQATKSGYRRARMLSALTLLRSEDTHQDRSKWSYVLLAEELRRVSSEPKIDAPELFKRMCFNALITNNDDHPRNHAVIAMDTDWRLSPAYDLVPAMPISIERRDLALECGDMGRYAHVDNLLSQSARFLLKEDEAKAIIDDMEQTVKNRWYEICRREGVNEKDCETISPAFAYEGFRLDLAAAS
ncbi:MAG: type II toxin-antitoxin system HipA family toxin [Gammaproteobacteria bacterium]|nr:type II toxin-antitoxin system HipA family toxin [Gammaproteobacteria bacterium]MDH3805172.1 type II toxin-antitoxin system HipA family toxin [Gammaproteobacteria bacterium]